MRECARQNDAADAAGRGASYAVDDDLQIESRSDRSQERKVDLLCIMAPPVIAIHRFKALAFLAF
jgi:hypothetical protein